MRVAELVWIRGPPTRGDAPVTIEMTFHVPPSSRGQTVEYAYAVDQENGRILMRVRNRALPPGQDEKIFARPLYEGEVFDPNKEPRDGKWKLIG
jgi:hypothetical protein